jgi:hypothetical protein
MAHAYWLLTGDPYGALVVVIVVIVVITRIVVITD